MRTKVLFVALVALLLGACGSELLEPAAAVVNGDKITTDEMDEALAEYERSDAYSRFSEQGDPEAFQRAFQQRELSLRIRIAVLSDEAEERGLEVTNADIDTIIEDEIQESYSGSRERFEEVLREQGIAATDLPDLYRVILLERRLKDHVTADLTPSEQELRAFYTDNAQRYIETDVSHIVVETRSDAARIANALSKEPEGNLERAFAEFAREESLEASSAAVGGDLGTLLPGEGDPAFEQAVSQIAPGTVSQPIQTQSGWELVLVKDRRPIPFDDARRDIIETLAGEERDRAWEEWLLETYESAEIEVNPSFGEFDPATQDVVDPTSSELPGTEDVDPTADPGEGPVETPEG